jgi:hypothetical protein
VRKNYPSDARNRRQGRLGTCFLAAFLLLGSAAQGADYGRVSGSVLDSQGNPLVGATVLITGPVLAGASSVAPQVERLLTDARGKFIAEHLLPGWYSLRVTSATRVPEVRNGIHVEPGQTVQEKFVLSDIFAPIRFQAPPVHWSTWGDDWKWVLRTSASTRPVLRWKEEKRTEQAAWKPPLPPSERLIGMTPGSPGREGLEGDMGPGTVLAYLRPLSAESDLLVAGSMAADGTLATSLATSLRRNLTTGDPQEFTLVMHRMNFSEGASTAGVGRASVNGAQAMTASYKRTRRISDSLVVTSGIAVNYLRAGSDVATARPHAEVEYRPDSSDTITLLFGTWGAEADNTLLERIGLLNAFPQVTLRGNRPRLETINHSEVSFDRKLNKFSRAELAAYSESFGNTAVWGVGGTRAMTLLQGNALPNRATKGVTLNAGDYRSAGIRATFACNLGSRVETAVVYTTGAALTVKPAEAADRALPGNLREVLSPDRSQSVAGKVSARIPVSKTQITASYQWVQRGRVTGLDPYGQASLQLEPFLGVQIRQPLPTLAFLPAHVEALADFRNLLAQGYVPVSRSSEQFSLTPAYRSFRGGFSVEF